MALQWLGGSEEDVARRRAMQALLGHWQGEDGSHYALTRNGDGRISVATCRPDGRERFTKGLITVQAVSGSVVVVWGRAERRFVLELDAATAAWRRGRRCFQWQKKLQ